MLQQRHVLAGSTVVFLSLLGAGSAVFNACSPNNPPVDSGVDAPVCNPDSGDPAGCPCDPGSYKPTDCYTGPPGTSSKGICQPGTRKCTQEGTFTTCVGEITPLPETCNYTDDDCNGYVDDLFNDAAVVARCNSPACQPNFADAAITCWGPDPGICGAGTLACQGGPKGGTPNGCNEFIHTPAQETCNGIDDDCNGTIDDGLDQEGPCTLDDGSVWPADANPFEAGPDGGGQITQILGECVHGNLTCVASNCDAHSCKDAGDQCFPTQPTTESCNGKDDNCNGTIDEGSCLTYPAGYNWCCAYSNNTYAYCTTTFEGDGGNGQFYNCHYAR
jgi:hypothetical protein